MRSTKNNFPHLDMLYRVLLVLTLGITSIYLLNFLNLFPTHWFIIHIIFQDFWLRSVTSLSLFLMWTLRFGPQILNPGNLTISSLILLLIILIDSFGNLFGWYAINESYGILWYDTLAHLMIPGLFTIFLVILISSISSSSMYQNSLRALLLGIVFVFLFEIYELTSDTFFQTHMIQNQLDTLTDILFGILGCFAAFLYLNFPTNLKYLPSKMVQYIRP